MCCVAVRSARASSAGSLAPNLHRLTREAMWMILRMYRNHGADAADWLQRESVYLRKVSRLLDTAAGQVEVVLERSAAQASAP